MGESDGAALNAAESPDLGDAVARALLLGRDYMNSVQESNANYEKRTGEPSRISEQDYISGENEVAAVFLKYQGIGPIKAKRMIQAYREKLAS